MIYLLAVALVALAASSIDIQKYAGVMFLALVVAVVATYFVLDGNKQAARDRITPTELVLEDIDIAPKSSSYRITGRVINNSETAAVLSFSLEILARDCAPEQGKEQSSSDEKCVTIGQVEEQVFVEIPPGQARDIDDQVYFHGGRLHWSDHMRWETKVLWVEAKLL
jgi:hypothetical protein